MKPPPSIAEVVYTLARRKILCNEFRGGESLDATTLAHQLNVGRTPVREALQRLEREKLVRVLPRKGVVVTELSLDTLGQIFEVRSSCEVQVARLAALRASAADIEVMESALADTERLVDERRFVELFEADERFHGALANGARNPLLHDMLSMLYGLGIRYWNATLAHRRPEDVKHEIGLHRRVLEAVKARDPEASGRAAFAIIEGFPDRITDLVRRDASNALFS